jgi:hypothetical protein
MDEFARFDHHQASLHQTSHDGLTERPPSRAATLCLLRRGVCMLDNLLGYIRTYRELAFLFTSIVGVFVSVVGGVFFVRDYFATKADVATLKCQAESSIAIIDSRINTDHLTQQLISPPQEAACRGAVRFCSFPFAGALPGGRRKAYA